ncbi:DUF6519 domain-containing protein [Micromonospora humida]|uniref:DUF6519 domain-containing protein n=1 Tax=Micromonospora humida TaxID=2809018 RepID=UPI003445062C
MVAPLADVDAGTIRPDAPGRDERLGFGKGDWVEATDPARVRRGLPGFLAQFREDGVQVQFDTAGSYRTGDYCLIPARTANLSAATRRARPATSNGRVTTPARGAGPAGGVAHSFAPVALLDLAAAGTWTQVADLRRLFRPLTASAGATVAIPARGRRAEGVERGGASGFQPIALDGTVSLDADEAVVRWLPTDVTRAVVGQQLFAVLAEPVRCHLVLWLPSVGDVPGTDLRTRFWLCAG